MALLDNDDRVSVWADFMRLMAPTERAGPMTKTVPH
jgi:hypothetical protein